MRLDLLDQDAAEDVAPGVFSCWRRSRRRRSPSCAKRRRSGPSGGSAAIRSMPAKRSNASATVIRSGSANGSARAVAEAELPGARGLRSAGYHRHAVVHQQLVVAVRPVPFEHGEFRMVQRVRSRDCGSSGRTRRSAARRPPEASCRRIPGRCADSAGRGRWARPVRSASHGHGSRCPARPAASRSRPRRIPAPRTGPAPPGRSRPAAIRNGRRSAWVSGAQKRGRLAIRKRPEKVQGRENRWRSGAGSVCCAPK